MNMENCVVHQKQAPQAEGKLLQAVMKLRLNVRYDVSNAFKMQLVFRDAPS